MRGVNPKWGGAALTARPVAREDVPPMHHEPTEQAATEAALDARSAERITTVLRQEQHARDGRPLAQAWAHLARRIEQDYPQGSVGV